MSRCASPKPREAEISGGVTMLQALPHVLHFKCVSNFGEGQPEYHPRFDTSVKPLGGRNPCARGARILRMGGKAIRTMPLDCNDGAALRVAPVEGPDSKLRNEFCPQVSPSQVRDACSPHDASAHRNTHNIESPEVHYPCHPWHARTVPVHQPLPRSDPRHSTSDVPFH